MLAKILQKETYELKDDEVVVPILNVTRKQLQLRTEILFWFQEAAKLDLKLLICKDEVEWSSLKNGLLYVHDLLE